MRTKYKHSFDQLWFINRWKQRRFSRSDTWTIIGIRKAYFSPNEYEYAICLFGFELRIWMNKTTICNRK